MISLAESKFTEEKPVINRKTLKSDRKTPVLISYSILIILLSVSFFASKLMKNFVDQQVREQLEDRLEQIKLVINNRMERSLMYLSSAQALFAASKLVERDEWHAFVEKTGLFDRYPGLVASAYIERVAAEQKNTFIENVRADKSLVSEGFPDFNIFPDSDKSEYFVIKFIEPPSERTQVMGFDVSSEPERNQALENARDLGLPVATSVIRLIQDIGHQPSIAIYAPVYRNSAPVSSVDERRQSLIGFVGIAIRIQGLLGDRLSNDEAFRGIKCRIYDGEPLTQYLSDDYLLFDDYIGDDVFRPSFKSIFKSSVMYEVGHRVWTIEGDAGPEFYVLMADEYAPYYVLLMGMVFSFLVFVVVYLLSTARSRAEETAASMLRQLERSMSVFRAMSDNAPLGIFLADMNGNAQYANRVFNQITGLKPDESKGFGWLNVVHPSEKDQVRHRWLEAVKKKGSLHEVVHFSRPDTTSVWACLHTAPVLEGGIAIGFMGILEDVSEHMLMEIALRGSERYNRNLFDQSPIGLVLCNTDGAIVDVNAAFAKIVGRSEKECLNRTFWDFVPKERLEFEKRMVHNIESVRGGGVYETGFLHASGRLIAVRVWRSVVQKGDTPFIMSSVEDISDRKEMEEGLKRAQEDLVEAEKTSMVAKLAAGAAHEVKNPLSVIIQGIDFLSNQLDGKDAEVSQTLFDMQTAVKRADSIIRGLLDVAVFTEVNQKPENLNAIINGSLQLIKNILDRKHISVLKSLASNIPPIKLDRNKIVHVLLNIFTNATDAMEEGGTLTVRTSVISLSGLKDNGDTFVYEGINQGVCLEADDTGHGIPADVLDHVFEPFFTTKRGKGGTGLGLSLVRNIVQMHNGIISLENLKDRKGVRAKIVFPILKNTDVAEGNGI
ncbi:MAG: CHASE domain-containing protein [Candidatus Omnitrophica bacterium]|nr:CHASE domain-containing protein [Candidatus Omnitrophota bacterium]